MPEVTDGKVQIAPQVDQDVKEAIARLAKIEGVSQGDLIGIAVRAYDAAELPVEEDLPDDAKVVLPIPRDREMLIDCIFNLLAASKSYIHSSYVMAALAMARNQYQKGLPEWKAAERMREEFEERRAVATRTLAYSQKGASLK